KVVPFQAFYFWPMLLLQGLGIRLASAQFIMSGRARYPWLEATGIAIHGVFYVSLLALVLSPLEALLFVAVHHGVLGFYMGTVFAPNHKGMPIIPKESPMDLFERQVRTTRNIKPNPVIDFMLGGLNYQIEHHLFPQLSRNRLGSARRLISAFC